MCGPTCDGVCLAQVGVGRGDGDCVSVCGPTCDGVCLAQVGVGRGDGEPAEYVGRPVTVSVWLRSVSDEVTVNQLSMWADL